MAWGDRLRDLFAAKPFGELRIDDDRWSGLNTAIGSWRRAAKPSSDLMGHAIYARQGCTREQAKQLRAELARVRAHIIEIGGTPVYVKRTDWQRVVDRAREEPDKLELDDLLRLVAIGEVARSRDRLQARRDELRASRGEPLVLAIDWALTGRFDRDAARSIVAGAMAHDNDYDGAIERIRDEVGWLLVLEPSDLARDYVRDRKDRVARARKRWRRGADGDLDEVMMLDLARSTCQRAIVDSWSTSNPGAGLAAIDAYLDETFGYWHVEASLLAVAVGEQISGRPRSPEIAYARLRSHVSESLDPPPRRELADDPGLAALDVLDAALARDAGLTVKTSYGHVTILAEPHATDPDFF